ncbi:MAG: DOMON domain-containing protein [Dehalogenimonas sp.]
MQRKSQHLGISPLIALVGIILSLVLFTACGGVGGTPSGTTNSSGVTWKSDGVVSEGEYTSTKIISDTFTLWWNTDSTYIYIAMQGTSPINAGYVGLGFLPPNWTPSMQKMNTDAIIGFVAGGKATVVDTFITGAIGPHPNDGKNDVEQSSGSVNGNTTVIEFKRKLNTGDNRDQPLVKGTNKIMWAVGFEPEENGAHAARGYSEIEIQ